MAATGVQAWKNICEKNLSSLPVPFDRQQRQNESTHAFNISLKVIDGLLTKDGRTDTLYSVRLCLFDSANKQFFGRTWCGPATKPAISGQKLKLNYSQNVYFHTPLRDDTVLLVLEVSAQTHNDDGKLQEVSCGWGVFRIFSYEGEMKDVSSGSSGPLQKISLYKGSPRALIYLDEPIEDNKHLSRIPGCEAQFHVRTHRGLRKVQQLIPENTILGPGDHVPGLATGKREPHGAPDPLKKPKLQRRMPCHLTNISVGLNPSVEKFEEELCRQLTEDMDVRAGEEGTGGRMQILQRYLQVGVHNGWSYISEPEKVTLSPDTGGAAYKKTASFRKGHRRTGSGSSITTGVKELVHKNRVEVDGMLEDSALTLIFCVVYECGPPAADKRRGTHSSVYVFLRWTAFCPFSALGQERHTLDLQGGPGSNPESVLVFQSAVEMMGSTVELSKLSGGSVSFSIHLDQAVGKENVSSQMVSMERPISPASVYTDGGSVLQELQSARPPRPPSSARSTSPADLMFGDHRNADLNTSNNASSRSKHDKKAKTNKGQNDQLVPPLQGFPTTPRSVYSQSPYPAALPQQMYHTPQQQGYMPVEIQHMHSAATTGRIQELQELPFTPVHAPIMAVAPGMHSGNKLSRAAYAKLYTAGFPQILDRRGEPPEVIDPSDDLNFILAKEEKSKLQANEIYFQFLAYSRLGSFEYPNQAKQPATVYFTFQFYRFPQITTDRLLLGNPQGELSVDPNALPCLLQQLEKDGSVKKGPPGYQIKYDVDPSYMKPGEGRLFAQHLSQQTLHIDVWDGDSLHLIGSCAVELKHLCRQGRGAVQVTYELDVVSTEYIEHENTVLAGDLTRDGSVRPVDVATLLKGRLHLRLANVGHQADTGFTKSAPVPRQNKVVVTSDAGMSSFLGGSLSALNSHTRTVLNTKIGKANNLCETNHELASVLFTQKTKAAKTEHMDLDKERKLSRMAAVRQVQAPEDNKTVGSYRLEKEERARDLKTIDLYRRQTKKEGILAMLSQAISTEHTIHPSMGTTEFFEFVLRNPYNHEFTVVVDSDDPDLIPITDTREWRHFKMLNELYTSVEEGLFNMETKSGKPEIFLKPKDKVHVPFKYLTFSTDHSVNPLAPQGFSKPDTKQDLMMSKKIDDPMATKLIRVAFRSQSDNKPLSVLAVRVEPQPHVIDQTFRFHHPEQAFLKKSIRMPPLHTMPGVPIGGTGFSQVYVRCSDPNVIAESKKVQQGEPHDVFLKAACGPSPQVKRFFMCMYLDPYLSRPLQIWQFYVHALQRVDVASIEGQTSRFTLILKGTQASRLVQCFPSHPLEMQLHPSEPFMLGANTLQEIHTGIRPAQTGCKFLYIHVVDIEYHQLVRSWLVCVNSRVPVISKAFELQLPLGGGKGSNKRISYTNPYPQQKVFFLRSNREDLVQFKDHRVTVGGGETAPIGLRFAPQNRPQTTEIMVFINDEDDKNEETFCIKAVYQ